jgi:sporulation protein YlmC with PRC-barrel domain
MTVYSSQDQYADQSYNADARANWDNIGEISDLLITPEGQVKAVLVDVGGFLGMGEHRVALDMANVHLLHDDSGDRFAAVNSSADELKSAPAFERTDTTTMASDGGMSGTMAAPGADTTMTGKMADNSGSMDNSGGMMSTGTDTTTADNATAPMVTPGTRPAMQREGYTDVDYGTITADELKSATVYDVNDDAIGEISELVLDQSGKIDQAVVDVGGFLGIGAHQVALPFDNLQIMQNSDGSDFRVYVDESKDSLEQRPEYEG